MRPIFIFKALLGWTAFLAWTALGSAPSFAQTPQSLKPAPDAETGKQAFTDNCARCHGPGGAGDGRDSKRMFPHPRNLAEGIFKFRTTASGTPPTDEDLFRTISEGLPGSRMPDFQRLPEETRWQLVYHVKSLSSAFRDQKPEPLKFGKDPGKGNLEKGKQLYAQLGCNACHGNLGRGNGAAAATLVDQGGNPISPADLTQGWNYRGGSSPKEVLVRLMTGLDGTPMPSYAEAVKPEEVWDLAYYVRSLQDEPRWSRGVEAVRVSELPAAADDPQWKKAPRADLRLSSNFYRTGELVPSSVNAVSVQAVYNENEILFRLSWHDRSESREAPPDAVALASLPDPNMKWRAGSLRSWPALPGDKPAVAYWSAAATAAPLAETEALSAQSGYADGEWTLVARRPLPGKQSAFGVLVWDGGNSEQGRHRANSNWVELILKEGVST